MNAMKIVPNGKKKKAFTYETHESFQTFSFFKITP